MTFLGVGGIVTAAPSARRPNPFVGSGHGGYCPPEMATGRRLSGIAASDGVAIGPARLLVPPVIFADRRISRDLVPAEGVRLRQAVTSTDEQLALLSARLESQHLHEGHLILEAHRMMLRDDGVGEGARHLIENDRVAAECAVRRVIDGIAATFARMEDPYLRE